MLEIQSVIFLLIMSAWNSKDSCNLIGCGSGFFFSAIFVRCHLCPFFFLFNFVNFADSVIATILDLQSIPWHSENKGFGDYFIEKQNHKQKKLMLLYPFSLSIQLSNYSFIHRLLLFKDSWNLIGCGSGRFFFVISDHGHGILNAKIILPWFCVIF